MTWASQINEYSLVASGTCPAHGAKAYKGCLYWSAVHLAITFRHINYLLTKRGRGDNGIVTVVTMALCAGAGRGYGAILTTVLTTVGSSILSLSVNAC